MIQLFIKKIPFIIWDSGFNNRLKLNSLELKIKVFIKSIFIKISSGYVTYGRRYANWLINKGYDKNKLIVAQNTINVEKIFDDIDKDVRKRSYQLINFLFVGKIVPLKNLEKVVKACKILSHKKLRYRLDIVGEGETKNQLVSLTKSLGLDSNIQFHGAKYGDEVVPYFKRANVFILPGTGGLAVNEAMAYSLPIISTPGDGTIIDLVKNKQNGFLLPYDYTVEKLAETMKYFIDLKNEKLKEMEQKSRSIIEDKATLNNMTDKFVEMILQ